MQLNNFQAIAVLNAMHALNNVGGSIRVTFTPTIEGDKVIKVQECEDTGIISVIVDLRCVERYETQQDFAEAYGLNY